VPVIAKGSIWTLNLINNSYNNSHREKTFFHFPCISGYSPCRPVMDKLTGKEGVKKERTKKERTGREKV
jgi:hypothetical protein